MVRSASVSKRRESVARAALAERSAYDTERMERRLRQIFGLTGAEARVAALITLGQTVAQIAVTRDVKESTLRTQLRGVFRKTGTNRQAELVRSVLDGYMRGADN